MSSLRARLAAGDVGVALRLPERFVVQRDEAEAFEADDPDLGVRWFFFHFPGMLFDLDLAHRETLREGLEQHARFMFDNLFAHLVSRGEAAGEPRTADAAWSPLVEATPTRIGEARALRVLHRMTYQPGHETLLGHLLVPLAGGLFEARVLSRDGMTGLRESVVMLKREDLPHPGQAAFDDPALDEAFPKHCLSRARAALRWLEQDSGLAVGAPAPLRPHAEVVIDRFDCALVPPPRFFPEPHHGGEALFVRVAFCGTDGVEHLRVKCAEAELGRLTPRGLRWKMLPSSRDLYLASGVREVSARQLDNDVVVEGLGHQGRLRGVFRWFLDDGGRPWYLCFTSQAAAPAEARVRELDAVQKSFRLTSPAPPGAPSRPWWKLF